MRAIFRWVTSGIAVAFGALAGANWQKWAEATGNDQYLVRYAGPVMNGLASITQSTAFIFFAGFFVGGAVCLWIDRLLRGAAPSMRRDSAQPRTASDIAHGFSPVGGSAVLLGIDKTKKTSEIGFQIQNTSGIPIRWEISDFSTSLDGHSNANVGGRGASGVAPVGGLQKVYGGSVQYIPPRRKAAKGFAKIVYRYGTAVPDTPMLREAVYAVEIDINPDGAFRYTILEENDAQI